jgi:hypothetical protein
MVPFEAKLNSSEMFQKGACSLMLWLGQLL